MKNRMKTLIAAALAALMLTGAALAEAATVTAQGTAGLSADPDIVTFNCGTEARGADSASAQAAAAAAVSAATEALIALGVAREDISTAWYNVYPYYEEGEDGRMVQAGYEANHSLYVTCRDLTRMDAALSAAVGAGMTNLSGITFGLSNRHALYLQALDLAVAAAREKAEILAAAGGLTLTGVSEILEIGTGDTAAASGEEADAGIAYSRAAGTGIAGGSVSVSASVTAVFGAE